MNSTKNTRPGGRQQPRTSRGAAQQQRGVIAILRALAPRRRLGLQEALVIADLQASRLLQLAGLDTPPTPTNLITDLPRVLVELRHGLSGAGSAEWIGGRWLICLDADDAVAQRRFTLAHEFKHVIDHRDKQLLYGDAGDQRAEEQAERVAEHFAICLLLPKRWLVSTWSQGHHDLTELANGFGVSRRAVMLRLQQLGLRVGLPVRRIPPRRRGPTRYTRPITEGQP